MLLTSGQNPKIKQVKKLRDRRDRDETGLFLIEGYRELMRAVDAGWKIESLFISPLLFLGTNESELIERIKGMGSPIFETPDFLFRSLSYRDRPDGLLAVAYQKCLSFNDLNKSATPFYIIAESIEKPGNLGTILRSADGVGCDGVIICDRCTDIYNPNVVRASTGTLFTQPVVEATTEETIAFLQSQGVAIVAATPEAPQSFTEANFKGPIAIVVGTEQLGLSEKWKKAASIQVSIPMLGVADSLNVAVATTLLLYEVIRQRHAS
jgi:TrmH family RNA methyltransferase